MALLDLVQFDFDHCYCFSWHDARRQRKSAVGGWNPLEHVSDEEDGRKQRVESLGIDAGAELEFLYDFGHSWRFRLVLEQVEPVEVMPTTWEELGGSGFPPEQYPRCE